MLENPQGLFNSQLVDPKFCVFSLPSSQITSPKSDEAQNKNIFIRIFVEDRSRVNVAEINIQILITGLLVY